MQKTHKMAPPQPSARSPETTPITMSKLSDCVSGVVDPRRPGAGVVVFVFKAVVVVLGAAVVVVCGVVSGAVVVVVSGVVSIAVVVDVLNGTKTQPIPSRLYMPSGQRAQNSLPEVFLKCVDGHGSHVALSILRRPSSRRGRA